MTRSKSCFPLWMISRCPFVTGSKEPGYMAVRVIARSFQGSGNLYKSSSRPAWRWALRLHQARCSKNVCNEIRPFRFGLQPKTNVRNCNSRWHHKVVSVGRCHNILEPFGGSFYAQPKGPVGAMHRVLEGA